MFGPRKRALSFVACFALAAGAGGVALASTSATSAAGLPQLELTLNGHAVAVAGQKVSGGVEVVVHTTGERFGSATFIRLNPGLSFSQAFAMVGNVQDLNVIRKVGAIVLNVSAPKGTTHVQVNLQPGSYVALDTSGMGRPPTATFTISQSAHPATLPRPGATLRAIEFGFRGPGTLHTGELVRWQNDGFLVHMLNMIGTNAKFPAGRIVKLLREGKGRQIPFSLNTIAGANPISWQSFQQQRLTLRPGAYVLACFENTQDGRDHTRLGMERVIHVLP